VSINKGWSLVNELGHLDRDGVSKAICESMVGMVTLLPANNFINSLPVKMFEYMAAKLPIIASDFQLWKSIIEANNCGLCVNPTDINQIANAIKTIIDNKELRLSMAENGYQLVKTKYNWDIEERKLIKLYNILIKE
jgi:glycosyltransferase involved in cell wall biosynthesis